MTLTELYNLLNWNPANEAIRKWKTEKHMAEGSDPTWNRTFRSAIIYEALYGEDEKRRRESIAFLRRIGIWVQIVRILRENQLIGEAQAGNELPSGKPE